ncbi:uncharacterized protein CGFF_05625 [Nakaseomyces glabratus]|nr:uncharacterized protein CGFF_05625 [Nakaseomyces glabratus]
MTNPMSNEVPAAASSPTSGLTAVNSHLHDIKEEKEDHENTEETRLDDTGDVSIESQDMINDTAEGEAEEDEKKLTNSFDELSLLPPLPHNDLSFDVIRAQQLENMENAAALQELDQRGMLLPEHTRNGLDALAESPESILRAHSSNSPDRSASPPHRMPSLRSSTPLSPIVVPSAVKDSRTSKMILDDLVSNNDELINIQSSLDYNLKNSQELNVEEIHVPPSPKITSPKASLKKKFSNTLLTTGGELPNINTNTNGNINGILTSQKHSPTEFPQLSKVATATSNTSLASHSATPVQARTSISSRPRRSTSITNSVQRLVLETANNDTKKPLTERKPSLKRYTSSINTPNTDLDNVSRLEAQLYNLPAVTGTISRAPSVNSGRARSQSQSVQQKLGSTDMQPLGLAISTTDLNSIDSKTKRPPFLRRASSALMRKASMKMGNENASSPMSPVTPLPTPVTAIDKKPYIRSTLGRQLSSTSIATDANIDYSGKTGRNVSTPLMRTSSFSHKMKRGLTRIMSTNGSSARISNKPPAEVVPSRHSQDFLRHTVPDNNSTIDNYALRNGSNGDNSDNSVLYMAVDKRYNGAVPKSNSADSANMDYFNFPKTEIIDPNFKTMAIDMDAWKSQVPVINVTDGTSINMPARPRFDTECSKVFCLENVNVPRHNSNNSTPLSVSTNSSQAKSNTKEENQPDSIKVMDLKDYIKFLFKQKTLEDSTYEKIEKQFMESGWCSNSDLVNIRHKRYSVNKKWDDVINFYQSKVG